MSKVEGLILNFKMDPKMQYIIQFSVVKSAKIQSRYPSYIDEVIITEKHCLSF
jgi:hypothetical protein